MDERLSLPGWLTYSRRITQISGDPSATGRALDRERSPTRDRCSTAVPRSQPSNSVAEEICYGTTYTFLIKTSVCTNITERFCIL